MLIEEWNVSRIEIAQAVRETFKVRNQRRRTLNNLTKAQKLDVFLESAQRKLKRTLLFQKRSSSQVQDMMLQAAEVVAFLAKVAAANGEDQLLSEELPWDAIIAHKFESEADARQQVARPLPISANSA